MTDGRPPTFGQLLRQYRAASGFSQETLAERAGISVAAIGALERGMRRAPQRETLEQIAAALELGREDRERLEAAALRARARVRRMPASDAAPGGVRPPPTACLGRERELADLSALLATARLVTIVGTGGVGKTRVALELAAARRDERAYVADLATVAGGGFVASVVAAAAGSQAETAADLVAELAARGPSLVVLDNCEHVVDAAAALARALLEGCPNARVLATSRERLRVAGERSYRVPPLAVPPEHDPPREDVLASPSVALFVDRATAAGAELDLRPGSLGAIVEICRRLDGLPLAIELAASRVPALGLTNVLRRLHEPFVLRAAERERAPRHRTLEATIAWSYDLLEPLERDVLASVATFRGGFTLDAAEFACSGDGARSEDVASALLSLADKHLVLVDHGDDDDRGVRYALFETIRQFGLRELERTGRAAALGRQHGRWIAAFAERADALYGELPIADWLRLVLPEIGNVRVALDRAVADGPDDEAIAGRIAGALRAMWLLTQRFTECRTWVEAALGATDEARHPAVVARLLRALFQCVDGKAIFAVAERARPLLERVDPLGLAGFEVRLASEFVRRDRLADGERSAAAAAAIYAAHAMTASPPYVNLLMIRAMLRATQHRFAEAYDDLDGAVLVAAELGDPRIVDWIAAYRAHVVYLAGDVGGALALVTPIAARYRAAGERGAPFADVVNVGGMCRLLLGDLDGVRASATEVLGLTAAGNPILTVLAVQQLGSVATRRGDAAGAARLLGFVDAWCARNDYAPMALERASVDDLRRGVAAALPPAERAAHAASGAALDLAAARREALQLAAERMDICRFS